MDSKRKVRKLSINTKERKKIMGIEKLGIVAKQIMHNNVGNKIGKKGNQLLKEYTQLVGSKSSNPKEYAELLQHGLKEGRMANFNVITGERIQYPKSFLKKWNERQELLKEYAQLVGSKSSNPKEYAELLQHGLNEGRMAKYNVITGEKIQYPKTFVEKFQSYQA